jgi:hypothetical protein
MALSIYPDQNIPQMDPDSVLKLYNYFDSILCELNKRYNLISHKISPLGKLKRNDKISVKCTSDSFCFSIDSNKLTRQIIRLIRNQTRKKFFSKFFMIIDYYHKTCAHINSINKIYPNIFRSAIELYLELGKNILRITNVLEQTYNSHKSSVDFINIMKTKIKLSMEIIELKSN